MWDIPNTAVLFGGSAEGATPLNAFDNALLDAGVGHLNLVKVSSVVPPGSKVMDPFDHEVRAACQPGVVVPCVMNSYFSSESGEIISACVGVGLPTDANDYGMVYEFADIGNQTHTVETVTKMLHSAFARREIQLDKVFTECKSHKVQHMGCVVAVALLLRL